MDPTTPAPQPTEPIPAPRDPDGRYGPGAHYDPPPHQERDPLSNAAAAVARHARTPETKEFFKTSEFLVWGLVSIFLLLAAALVTGDADHFIAQEAWLYVTILSSAYIISRGLAKSGTRRDGR